jgi:hypothetical protein
LAWLIEHNYTLAYGLFIYLYRYILRKSYNNDFLLL